MRAFLLLPLLVLSLSAAHHVTQSVDNNDAGRNMMMQPGQPCRVWFAEELREEATGEEPQETQETEGGAGDEEKYAAAGGVVVSHMGASSMDVCAADGDVCVVTVIDNSDQPVGQGTCVSQPGTAEDYQKGLERNKRGNYCGTQQMNAQATRSGLLSFLPTSGEGTFCVAPYTRVIDKTIAAGHKEWMKRHDDSRLWHGFYSMLP
ncbi:unnamed protein product [Vitrella brassicaformis CCMP3155]|uniref:Uncharacterized protein n=1 Tax=Vitrella brassicaformis (strain CCMP3155) TaxID=1169540 RepID=A0A0G4ETK0_VITBC|nr:unnamed protein product [Vitrella brassicaformis CCMP3155]|eukprot:CEM01567.1 unnamed protein product [Vitrella brassicaformis CCMP3155]